MKPRFGTRMLDVCLSDLTDDVAYALAPSETRQRCEAAGLAVNLSIGVLSRMEVRTRQLLIRMPLNASRLKCPKRSMYQELRKVLCFETGLLDLPSAARQGQGSPNQQPLPGWPVPGSNFHWVLGMLYGVRVAHKAQIQKEHGDYECTLQGTLVHLLRWSCFIQHNNRHCSPSGMETFMAPEVVFSTLSAIADWSGKPDRHRSSRDRICNWPEHATTEASVSVPQQ